MAAAFESMEGEGFPEDLTYMQGRFMLRNVVGRLCKTHCDTFGVEHMHIGSTQKCNWICN